MRLNRKTVLVGGVAIGGTNAVVVQSMLNKKPSDIEDNIAQARALEAAGCGIIRAAAPTVESAKLFYALKQAVKVPIVADIHFDYKIALECVAAGVDKIRLNPGNIGDEQRIKAVVNACSAKNIPIRIGVNAGSLEKNILEKYGSPTAAALCESAMDHVRILEKFDFENIIISLKSSNVKTVIEAYTLLAQSCNYPLHVGVTEAGTYKTGLIKSALGIGALLLAGIGDTIRVSLAGDPLLEVDAGYEILRTAGHKVGGAEIIACPTCGRTNINVEEIAQQVQQRIKITDKPLKIAIMGCVVNGPGEAREADVGIAGAADGSAVLFAKGEKIKVLKGDIVEQLFEYIKTMN